MRLCALLGVAPSTERVPTTVAPGSRVASADGFGLQQSVYRHCCFEIASTCLHRCHSLVALLRYGVLTGGPALWSSRVDLPGCADQLFSGWRCRETPRSFEGSGSCLAARLRSQNARYLSLICSGLSCGPSSDRSRAWRTDLDRSGASGNGSGSDQAEHALVRLGRTPIRTLCS